MSPHLPAEPLPDLRSASVLRQHIADTMAFYHPHAIDPAGGYFQYFKDDGTIYDRSHRHLVSSTRFVFNYAMAAMEFADDAALQREYLDAARHGLRYLREVHRNPGNGGYHWTIRDGRPEDSTNHAYGVAFVLLAYATARKAGLGEAVPWMDETWDLLEQRFWDAGAGLYRDEADADWRFSDYRGQNANMHLCEAMLAAWQASRDARYLDRALVLADHMTRRQAAKMGGLVWEHYDRNWEVDPDYNRDDPRNLFRPWGFQPGHQTEWAKLLMILARELEAAGRTPPDWLLPVARHLFDTAVARAWDAEHGGLCYGFAPDGSICDGDKYFWVQAESLAAAGLLRERSGEAGYDAWYGKLWAYAWQHLVDHRYGAWYRILTRDNRKYDDEKSPAGKTDYHTMGACHEMLALIRRGACP
ncbi:AGE family epimerase/isomerase [Fulvimonas sp. R45]|uniref:AGE family epimerase/isomerase n=1 Tax=Fulvimonas sp. R45 TaxID=3045937 RepID=UPI00265D9196|nr:AGE family epimerase/isomerase [Fulvimonas sp. R45]MDO1527714.1 AGE family epimerase/isomerase [Fulvimonas sp. R45]